jgi:archaellum component FlaC
MTQITALSVRTAKEFVFKTKLYYDVSDRIGGDMAEAKQSHQHPDYDQRIKGLEEQIKKLQKEVQDLKHKMETHDHPHTH